MDRHPGGGKPTTSTEGAVVKKGKVSVALAVALATFGLTAGAHARISAGHAASGPATLVVDNDRKDCPNAGYIRIRAAIRAAKPGDTVHVCAGTYAEGTGEPNSNVLDINKSINLVGAGADHVTVE